MLVEKTGLWYRVLVARYGEEAWRVLVGGRRGSSWWREVSQIRHGGLEATRRGWVAEGVERRVGSGEETFYWPDTWLGGVPLSERYRRLSNLSLYKSSTVAEICAFGLDQQWTAPRRRGRGAVHCGCGRRCF
jgi:hypothetical protein